MAEQAILLQLPERPAETTAGVPEGTGPVGEPKLRPVNRKQTTWKMVDVEELIGQDHPARAIWELTGQLDLSRFAAPIRSAEGSAGRPAWDPRLLVSIWVYAYSEGISSAREIERLLEYEPGLGWLTGLEQINHHTLSDFRVTHQEALEELFAQLLGLLQAQGLVKLERVMHDGTKIRAQAGADSFRREKTVREHLEQARALVRQMGDPRKEQSRREAAQQRVARERQQRVEQALEQLEEMQTSKKTAEEKQGARVSLSEPEARLMKHGDQAIAPSYNVQISTDAAAKIIVGVEVCQSSSDAQLLEPALEEVEKNLGARPKEAVVDGGYTNRATIVKMAEQQIELIGSLGDTAGRAAAGLKAAGIDPAFGPERFAWEAASDSLRCPAGKRLEHVRTSHKRHRIYQQYQAAASDCQQCAHQKQCCPQAVQAGRTINRLEQEDPVISAFRQKMETPGAQEVYRQRAPVAEFPHCWIKEKLGVRKFRVRGRVKAGLEALWACLTYNIMQWIRLRWRNTVAAATA